MPRLRARALLPALALASLALLLPARARAILDVEDRGPTLQAGAFAMRITNIGVIGNPFFDIGRSFDPSFEYPRGSGNELLKHADLWVGAVNTLGHARVSGGPLLEWRPTLDPEDRVRLAYGGLPHTRRFFDDDGDGKVDEELLNGRDDDGDGQVDEDLGISAAQMAAAEYTDDQPAAISYAYPNGETHEPLHLHVRQEAYAWSVPGYDRVAGLQFVITNIGSETLHDLWVGLFTDLDSRGPGDAGGHLNDRLTSRSYARTFNDGVSRVPTVLVGNPPRPYVQACLNTDSGTWPVVTDGLPASGLPAAAVMGLSHTLDPIAQMVRNGLVPPTALPFTYAPAQRQFRWSVYANDEPPGQGGPPILDADRYRALTGDYPGVTDTLQAHDYVVLVSCGPFPAVPPGRSLEVNFALVAGQNADSVAAAMGFAADVHHGAWVNEVPDTVLSARGDWDAGKSGITGHEACVEPPPGLVFDADPNCVQKFPPFAQGPFEEQQHYAAGHCVWTDADCDVCTGFNGNETLSRWGDPGAAPPAPSLRAVAGDGRVTVEWDNLPELLVDAGVAAPAGSQFVGYNVYRLSDWKRQSEVPGPERFQEIAAFARDTLEAARPIAEAVDSTVDYERILYERKEYPVGRYRFVDDRVLNGFDYLYVVTAMARKVTPYSPGVSLVQRFESPIITAIDSIVSPRVTARAGGGGAWVVPNPFRAHAPWDRQPVAGDAFGRHLDFFGLPATRSTIRIWTLAGDLVQTLVHDGTGGGGQARWDLISRNGQEVESGIYLFTVDSPLGHQVGRFVVIR